MYICVLQVKGGVSKTSVSIGLALSKGFNIVSNDMVTSFENLKGLKTNHIDENLKTIPGKFFRKGADTVFDMGGMSGNIDPKTAHAVKKADCIVIPTLTDVRSIEGAIKTIEFVEQECNNIFVIVNRVKKEQEYQQCVELLKPYIDVSSIYCMKETTLFQRIAKDGDEWYKNIHHEKGSHQLLKTIAKHEEIYQNIIDVTSQVIALRK